MSDIPDSHDRAPVDGLRAPAHRPTAPWCAACARWAYPATDACPACGAAPVSTPVPDTGVVFTFTVNHHPYQPSVAVPYVIALVDIDDRPGLRLITNIVDCAPDSVRIGMPVRARLERRGGADVLVFAPRDLPA
ncbi:Zn-ribbon domain-containing OB-fold protein [Nocardia higoensis]|uniref:Zn-ribbon domain-containing OB-fold protein n=1 Tax=Nocardia higoensis TaxID=228599 RepID=UPI0014613D7D|nr:OB-fold domain-containing protein [Nocardia higoensis]